MGRLQLHSSYHQLSTVQSICLPGDTGNTGDTTSNCDTAMGGVGAVMNHVAVANSLLCSTHTHIDTHISAYVHGYTTAPCTRSTKAAQLTVDLARRAHQSPGRLVDEDDRSERSPSRTADRSGAERHGGLPCVGTCSSPGTASPSTERRRVRLASCPSSPSLVSSPLCSLARARADIKGGCGQQTEVPARSCSKQLAEHS